MTRIKTILAALVSMIALASCEQEIADFIGRGGRMIAYDGGAIWLRMGTPWAQRMGEPKDDMVRRIYINLQAEFLTEF